MIKLKAKKQKLRFTDSFPMHPFSTPWKHQKTVRFSEVFEGVEKGSTGMGEYLLLKSINIRLINGRVTSISARYQIMLFC